MKKSLLALAVLGAFSGIAAAQSSVTVFGVIDVDARYIKNKTGATSVHSKTLSTDGLSNSRLGFRGVEDLGGGLKAGFWLESALSAVNGTIDQVRFWGRRSTVSLLGGFGEVRLGRDFTPSYNGYADYATFGTNGSGGAQLFANYVLAGSLSPNQAQTATRADNMVSYFLPSGLGGLFGQFSIAAAEGHTGDATTFENMKYVGGRLGYAAGPVSASVSYGKTDVAPLIAGGVTDNTFSRVTAGASYDFGVAKLNAFYIVSKLAVRKATDIEVGATVPVGPGQIRVSYARIKVNDGVAALSALAPDANKLALGYVHNLSKRTALYATAGHINNKSRDMAAGATSQFNVASSGPLAGPAPGTAVAANPGAPGVGQSSTGYEFGIRHNF